jgi:hypothetical protein
LLAVLLGLAQRRAQAASADRRSRGSAASSYEAPADAADALQFGRAYWLPPFGRGNGLEALFWAPVARLADTQVDEVLRALAEQDIPAWAAPARRPRAPAGGGPHDLSVASGQLDAAQDVLLRVLAA